MSAAVVGGIIAFYQLGCGIAAFGAGPLQNAGISLSAIFGGTAIVAVVMAGVSFLVVKGARTRSRQPTTDVRPEQTRG
jgi:FHS family glucose/mannose:H+ symporter-like MFS transporter